jgi:hypothetical protein
MAGFDLTEAKLLCSEHPATHGEDRIPKTADCFGRVGVAWLSCWTVDPTTRVQITGPALLLNLSLRSRSVPTAEVIGREDVSTSASRARPSY